ncbi:MAG: hypothetical protein QOJ02_1870 [Acidobacteriota bacterium]|jgi:hypothetical protein|nr:hypothetical protein [Acidobacteriota bacterium]
MKRKYRWLTLFLVLIASIPIFTISTDALSIQRRKRKKPPTKVTAPIKNSPPTKNIVSSYDMSVEVKSTPFGKVVILTNREKDTITIRKVVINDEWEIKGSNFLHSTKSWTSLPVELKLGDELRAGVYPYEREVIYVDLETDKGKMTFKVNK